MGFKSAGVNISDADATVDKVVAPKTFYAVAPPKKTGTLVPIDISDAHAAVGEVLAGKTFYADVVPKKTGTMATVALDPALNAYPAGYHVGAASLTAIEADLIAAHIGYGYTIFGVVGTLVQWVYNLVMPVLSVVAPTIAMAYTNLNAGDGGQTDTRALTVVAPTIANSIVQATISAVGGGVAHKQTGPVDTDETTATNNATTNDMDLLPAAGNATGDGFYFGFASLWDALCLIVGTAGAGTYTITWKYWNGAWVALTVLNDDSGSFQSTGQKHVTFVRPADWAVTNIAALGNMYYIKAEVTFTSMTTQPKGTQAWILNY